MTYEELLDKMLAYDSSDLVLSLQGKLEDEINSGKYAKLTNRAMPGIYVLDYSQQKYLYVNDKMCSIADRNRTDLMEGGLKLALSLWDQDHLKVYNDFILPRNLDFFQSVNPRELQNLSYVCNYGIRHRDGTFRNVKQQSFYTEVNESGEPIWTLGFLWDITGQQPSNKIIHSISSLDAKSDKPLFHVEYSLDLLNANLTPREIEILRLSEYGFGNKQIAQQFGTQKTTVDKQKRLILEKTNSNNITEAVAKVIRQGLI